MSKHTPTLPWHRSLHPIKSPKVGYNLHDNSGNPCKIRILTNDIAVAYYVADAINAHDELIAAAHHTHLEWLRSTSERDASVRLEELGKDAAALLAKLEVGHD